MTTIPQTTLDHLRQTTSPRSRAAILNELADIHEMAGMPSQARLLALVADTEMALADENHELATEEDAAWEHDMWWRLAATRDRAERAHLLDDIYIQWAAQECGEAAMVLLHVAATERDAHGEEATQSGRYQRQAESPTADPSVDDTPTDVYEPAEPPPAENPANANTSHAPARGRVAGKVLSRVGMVAVPATAVFLVAAPATPLTVRFASAVVLVLSVLAWLAWSYMRGPIR